MSSMLNDAKETNYELISELGRRYKTYRKALKMSQKQVSDKTGVSLFTISAFENGKGQGLSLSHFAALLEALDLRRNLSELVPEIPSLDPERMWFRKK